MIEEKGEESGGQVWRLGERYTKTSEFGTTISEVSIPTGEISLVQHIWQSHDLQT